ncbi:HNH endonuclease [Luteolibacter sp. Populi]|uniref:HNH endonuclease n=1 Tax=Luteolibacter sp. Populi TaxID=3230487 RepID=UPI0034674180
MVLNAYGGRCALSGLPVRSLLTAAHIYPDRHEMGVADVTNGIALSTLHHTAYDTLLIGISPDLRIEVSDRIFSETDGPLLEGLKALHGTGMRVPREVDFRPNRDALAFRFEKFLSAR